MALDGLVLHQISKKLKLLQPAKINKIQQISNDEIIFILRTQGKNHKLMISCHSIYNRIHLTNKEYQTMEMPNNFLMVLRKYIDRSIITNIEQLGLDRILKITMEVKDELSDYHHYYLYVELMGKYANLILVNDENRIVDALKRIPAFENNSRTIHPGATYTLPKPHTDKTDPFLATKVNPDESLVKQFHGFSPLLSDEVMYRIKHGEQFTEIMQEIKHSDVLYLHHKQNDILYHLIELKHLQIPYSAYELMEAMDQLYYQKEEKVRIKQQSGDIYKVVRYELKKNRKKLGKLTQTLEDANELDKYRMYGDLLYAYGQYHKQHLNVLELPNFEDETLITIPLDDKIVVKQNAKKYYHKYNKSKTAQIEVAKQIKKTQQMIQYFENIEVQLDTISLEDAIEIKEELSSQGFMKKTNAKIRKKKKNAKPHFLTLNIDGINLYIGKNNIQNEYITFKQAKKDDTWLHVKDMHGSHVVITTEHPNEKILRIASLLAAYYSQGKNSSSVPVNYCLIKQLKRPNKAAMGFVTLTKYKTIYIDPNEEKVIEIIKQYQSH